MCIPHCENTQVLREAITEDDDDGGVYISQLIHFARVCSNISDFNNRTLFLTVKLLKQGYSYHKIRKAFSKFYHRHSELIVKYTVCLKKLFCNTAYKNLYYMVI